MTAETLEARVAALEYEVRRLRMKIAQDTGAVSGRTAPDFLDRFAGIFADNPTFENVVRDGEEQREREEANRVADEAEAN